MNRKWIAKLMNITVYDFRKVQVSPMKTLCYHNTKRMIDYFAGTTCFFAINRLMAVVFCGTCYLIKVQN